MNNTLADWRKTMFGDVICRNDGTTTDEECPTEFMATEEAFDTNEFKYIALFIGADYCPHCREFAPEVIARAPGLAAQQKCKTIFVSNDRDESSFDNSVRKVQGIDVMPYNLEKTKVMRELFGLKTIPALMILKNDDFDSPVPTVLSNARHALGADPKGKDFPWLPTQEGTKQKSPMSAMDRFIIRGAYGKWWELGHHVNPDKPEEMYMDDHAVRARAGLIHIISWVAIINIFFWQEMLMVKILYPIVAWEMLAGMTVGLSPVAPIGVMGTALAVLLHPEPYWKPAKPKRFAWAIAFMLATLCLTFFLLREELGEAYRPLIGMTVITCNVATWFEASCGFCFGCFVYNSIITKWFDLEECQECKL